MAQFKMTSLHARVLAWFEAHGVAPADEPAAALGMPVAVIEAVLSGTARRRPHRAGT
jgi:hypothetical protein